MRRICRRQAAWQFTRRADSGGQPGAGRESLSRAASVAAGPRPTCQRSRNETLRISRLRRTGLDAALPTLRPRGGRLLRRLQRRALRRPAAVVEHLRQAQQVPDPGRRAPAALLARLLRCPEELLLRPP